MHLNSSSRRDIRNLLVVFGSGLVCALILAGIMLYYYGPTGRYFARYVLLDPSLTHDLSYEEVDASKNQSQRYLFDGFDFSYYDKIKKAWLHAPVDQKQYQLFYDKISPDASVQNVTSDMVAQFNQGNAAVLSLKVKADKAGPPEEKSFQQLHILNEGNYYRVQLRDQRGNQGSWAYFEHPGIYQEALNIFVAS
jgi:hypothetical protein